MCPFGTAPETQIRIRTVTFNKALAEPPIHASVERNSLNSAVGDGHVLKRVVYSALRFKPHVFC